MTWRETKCHLVYSIINNYCQENAYSEKMQLMTPQEGLESIKDKPAQAEKTFYCLKFNFKKESKI